MFPAYEISWEDLNQRNRFLSEIHCKTFFSVSNSDFVKIIFSNNFWSQKVHMKWTFPRQTLDVLYFSGSGYVLSSGSLSALQAVLPSLPSLFKYDAIHEDIAMGVCMANIGAR